MLRSFRDNDARAVFHREFSRRLQSVAPIAKRKLDHLHSATSLSDLRAIPGNRLEALSGDREGQYSIRWVDSDACDVEIVDYH